MFRLLRIAVLLVVLATVAQEAWLARSRAVSWQDPLRVAIYPIAGDDGAATAAHLRRVGPGDFAPLTRFFEDEARRHGRRLLHPVEIAVAPPLPDRPPQPPRNGAALENLAWSLHMRYWAWRHDAVPGMKPQVRLFVLYFDPAHHERLPHSVGVPRGLIGVVNAFAGPEMAGSNGVILAHELLHTLGATDKYDPDTNLPRHPEGYAEPEREPRHPQEFAEVMGGRIPLSHVRAEIPENLERTLIGAATAAEIGWSR